MSREEVKELLRNLIESPDLPEMKEDDLRAAIKELDAPGERAVGLFADRFAIDSEYYC
jgi:hypothetical protein